MINVSNHRWFVCQASFTLCGHIEKEFFIKITAKNDTPIEFVPVRWRNTHLHFRAALQLSFTALPKSFDFFCRSAQRFWWTKSSWVKLRQKERNKQKVWKLMVRQRFIRLHFFRSQRNCSLFGFWDNGENHRHSSAGESVGQARLVEAGGLEFSRMIAAANAMPTPNISQQCN